MELTWGGISQISRRKENGARIVGTGTGAGRDKEEICCRDGKRGEDTGPIFAFQGGRIS
jgi:S-adenosylmethionine:tRNA-ribosyltransferase-isomerase (queuine synthetase)